jgi:hypothetical protein
VAGEWKSEVRGPTLDLLLIGDSRQVENMLTALEGAFDDRALGYDFLQDYVDPVLRRRTEDRFAHEGDDVSGPWAPLSPATVTIRQGQGIGGAHPINVRTGGMRRHLVEDPPRIATHSLGATMWSPGDQGSSKMKKKVLGAQLGEGNAPARPVLGVNELDLEAVMTQLDNYIDKHMTMGQSVGAF